MGNPDIKLPIQLSNHSREPIYYQIEQQLISLIASGHLKPGAMLPSIRSLAGELACSVITTTRAYQNLEQQGFIYTVQGKGTFVADVQREKKQKIVDTSLYQSLWDAIEQGVRLQNDEEQIKRAFETVLADFMRGRSQSE